MFSERYAQEGWEFILHGLATGRIRVVIGTHALIQETVQFYQLGLVVIDEQHRALVSASGSVLVDKGQISMNGRH